MKRLICNLKDPYCALSHFAGTLLSIAGLIALLCVTTATPWHYVGFTIYGLSLIARAIPGTKPVTAVDTASPQVGLIIGARRRTLPRISAWRGTCSATERPPSAAAIRSAM